MLSICQVCLRTDRKLRILEDSLSNWHDEVCDFTVEDFAQFCIECSHLLRKFQEFKEKCVRAAKVLKSWKKQRPEVRTPLDRLKEEIPPSSLGFCSKKNLRIYFYQAPEINAESFTAQSPELLADFTLPCSPPTKHSSALFSNYPCILTINYLGDNNIETGNTQMFDYEIESKSLKQTEVKVENELPQNKNIDIRETIIFEELLPVNNDIDSDHEIDESCNGSESSDFDTNQLLNETDLNHDSSDDEIVEPKRPKRTHSEVLNETDLNHDSSDYEIVKPKRPKRTHSEVYDASDEKLKKIRHMLNETDLNHDSSDNEIVKPKRPKRTHSEVYDASDEKLKKIRHMKPLNMELLKKTLINIFARSGEVRDEEGNVIDKECILNSLDKMHIYTLNVIKKRCSGTKAFTPEAIQVLAQLQKKYGNQYSSVFITEHLATKEQVMAEFEKRQYYESYVSSEHKCTLCYQVFKHKKSLEYHVKMYHDATQPQPCDICQMRYKNRRKLLRHKQGHKAVYKCKLCPLVTNYTTAMVNHYNQHKGFVYTCELCKAIFKSKSALNGHVLNRHKSQYICSLCARTFVSDFGLQQHRNRKHQNKDLKESPGNKKCEQCNVTFVSDEVYQKHLEISHAVKKNNNKNNGFVYKKRKYAQPREKPKIVCRVCGKSGNHNYWLYRHYQAEHPEVPYEQVTNKKREHLCDECGRSFFTITDLHEHKHIHTGAKPYSCDKCPAKFQRKISLKMHLERHLPPTRECQHCGKKFVSASNLSNHIRTHTGDRRYKCLICDKGFLHGTSLKEHIKGVHHHIRRAKKPLHCKQ